MRNYIRPCAFVVFTFGLFWSHAILADVTGSINPICNVRNEQLKKAASASAVDDECQKQIKDANDACAQDPPVSSEDLAPSVAAVQAGGPESVAAPVLRTVGSVAPLAGAAVSGVTGDAVGTASGVMEAGAVVAGFTGVAEGTAVAYGIYRIGHNSILSTGSDDTPWTQYNAQQQAAAAMDPNTHPE